MIESSFETKIPQMGRAESSESHPVLNTGSLTDSGGGRKSTNHNKTKRKYTNKIFIATYNIRTMRTDSHLEELEQELKNIKWDVVGICETRLQGEKKITLRSGHTLYLNNSETNHSQGGVAFMVNRKIEHSITKYQAISERVIYLVIRLSRRYSIQIIHCYAPTSTASDESIQQFYEDITRAKNSENSHYVIITGDFNAKVGKRESNDTKYVGNFGLGHRNDRGGMLVNYLNSEKLFCLNTFFKKQAQRKWTWLSPDGQVKNEIDYVLANKNNICKDVTVLNQLHTGSDHRLVRASIQINTTLERKKLVTKHRLPTSDVLLLNRETYQEEKGEGRKQPGIAESRKPFWKET